jgi:hypothetical protein
MRWVSTIATQQASERSNVHPLPRARKLTPEPKASAQSGRLNVLSQIARA